MAQGKIQLPTDPPYPGLQMVQDINRANLALATDFAGPDDPAAYAFPYSTWADTGNMLLKRRNAANSDWVTLGPLFASMSSQAMRFIAFASGSGNWTVPDDVYQIDAELWAAGGGGGGVASAGPNQAAGGGGAGAYVRKIISVTPGQVLAYAVGTGGNGGGIGGAGSSGGTTSLGGLVSATGGLGGSPNSVGSGGSGGSPAGGDLNIAGGSGGMGALGTTANLGGQGGASPFGGSGGTSGLYTGGVGVVPGGGGAGRGTGNTGPGSNGANGMIIIRY